jgi:hypothetical protein
MPNKPEKPMDETICTLFDDLYSANKETQNQAFFALIKATDQPVTWAYEVWDKLVEGLRDKDNHRRAIASQLLCNLAKSDPEKRILHDFDALFQVTKDERFVTARHCLQNIWKIGIAGDEQREKLLALLIIRFRECETEKNGTLVRYDILEGLRKLYDATDDATVREKALALLETENEPKYRKKYATLWRVK